MTLVVPLAEIDELRVGLGSLLLLAAGKADGVAENDTSAVVVFGSETQLNPDVMFTPARAEIMKYVLSIFELGRRHCEDRASFTAEPHAPVVSMHTTDKITFENVSPWRERGAPRILPPLPSPLPPPPPLPLPPDSSRRPPVLIGEFAGTTVVTKVAPPSVVA